VVESALAQIPWGFTESISIDDLSSRFYLSRYYLMHTFKEQTGYSIGRYYGFAKALFVCAGKSGIILKSTFITDIRDRFPG